MLKSPQERGEVMESSPRITPYFDEVLRADQGACDSFVKYVWNTGTAEFTFTVENHITPSLSTRKASPFARSWKRVPPPRTCARVSRSFCRTVTT